jgi:cytochrome b
MTLIDEKPKVRAVERQRLVWDLPVRLVHWSLVVSFVGAFVTNRLGVAWFEWHVRFGYAVLALVTFRIVWGVVGTKHARFASFVRSPAETVLYARRLARGDVPSFVGHNPLGALMVVALLVGLGAQAAFGLFSNDEIFNTGPLASVVAKETSLVLTSWHRRGFYVLAAAAAIHIFAVVAHVLSKRDNLVRAMITGRKPARRVPPDEEIATSRIVFAFVLLAIVIGALQALSLFAVSEPEADAF